jgi:hypothetical protein
MKHLIDNLTEKLITALIKENSINYKLKGILITDLTERNQADILSDIRSLPGVTIVKATEYVHDEKMYQNKNYYVYLTVKIDPHPFIGKGGFGQSQIEELIADIKKIKGVRMFKAAAKAEKITI